MSASQTSIRIDPELKELLPPLTEWEFKRLEMNILASPERVAVVVWQERDVLLDGHNRYAICQKHQLHFRVDLISLPSLDAAKLWIINEHLGRRNFNDEETDYWMGKQLEFQKKTHGGDRESRSQNDTLITNDSNQQDTVRTRQEIAQQYRVGEATVERNMRFARDVDTIAEAAGSEARAAILSREVKMTRQEIQDVAKIAEAEPQAAKAVLTQIKGVKRQETKRIVAEASRRLPGARKSPRTRKSKNASNPLVRFAKIRIGYIDACLKEPQPVSLARIAKIFGLTTNNMVRNSILHYMALIPWLDLTPVATENKRKASPSTILYSFKSDRYLRAVCEGRIPRTKDHKAVLTALADLRRDIDRRRIEAKADRIKSNWTPSISRIPELVLLLDYIEEQLDKLSQ